MGEGYLAESNSLLDGNNITLPNFITSIRILLVAVFSLTLLAFDVRVAAVVVLMGIGITDFLDGFLARRLGQVSNLGKLLDPVADRLAILVCVSTLAATSFMPLPLAVVVLARELLISISAVAMMLKKMKLVEVSFLGKAATFGLYLSLPLFLFGYGNSGFANVTATTGEVLATVSVIGMFIATFNYAREVFVRK